MSCTVIAVPFLLYQAIGVVIAASAVTSIASNQETVADEVCEDVHVITAKHFMEKSFETVLWIKMF